MHTEPKRRVKHNYHMQWSSHANHMCTGLGFLLEHQTLVDVALCCGPRTIHAHKCVLAANSTYFRDRLSQVAAIEQIVFDNLDFEVVKCIIEYMYCGETSVSEENLKQLEAAANTFHLHGLQTMPSDQEVPVVEAPIFLSEKLKYAPSLDCSTSTLNPVPNVPKFRRKRRRDILSDEAEKACAKEAAASRLAINALNDELSMQTNNRFVIEESCSETTVENFIPRKDATNVSLEMQNYGHLNTYNSITTDVINDASNMHNVISIPNEMIHFEESEFINHMTPPKSAANDNNGRFKEILGAEVPDNVEIMLKVTDGNFINITEEMLQNMTEENNILTYQVLYDGQLSEVCDLPAQEKNASTSLFNPFKFNLDENTEGIIGNNYSFPYDTDISMPDADINALISLNSTNKTIGVNAAPRVNQVVNTDPFVNALIEIKEHLNLGDNSSYLNKPAPNKGRNVSKCETQTLASLKELNNCCDKESFLLDEQNTTESNSVLPSCFDFESVKNDINIIENEKVNNHDNEVEGNGENAENGGRCELSLKKGKLETRPSPSISEEVPMEMFEESISSTRYNLRSIKKVIKADTDSVVSPDLKGR